MPTAMVTGANRGIGLETVRQLLDRDYEVHATYRQEKGGLADISNPRLVRTKWTFEAPTTWWP